MARRTYNKLIRDGIPAVMDSLGKTYEVRRLDDGEYLGALLRKLLEEAEETVEADGDIGELADVLEVLRALSAAKGYAWDELEEARRKKAAERGGFSDRLFLIEGDL